MYLTDLTYINTVHPCTGGLDISRNNKVKIVGVIIPSATVPKNQIPWHWLSILLAVMATGTINPSVVLDIQRRSIRAICRVCAI